MPTALAEPGGPPEGAPGGDPGTSLAPEPQPPWWRRHERAMLALAIGVGLVLRVAIGLTDDAASTDETAYTESGTSLVAGDGFRRDGHPELHFPPLLPAAIGLVDLVVDDPHTGVVALTVLSSTALVLPLSLLARRLGGAGAGIATAWLAALVPGLSTMPQIRGTGSEAEYGLLVTSALWSTASAARRRGPARSWRLAASGLLVGLAYLTRPEGLAVAVPLGAAALALGRREVGEHAARRRREGSGPATPARWRRGPVARAGAAFLLPLAACVVPYAAYLHANTGSWQLTAKTQDASIEAWHAVARGDRAARNAVIYALDDTGARFSAEYSPLTTLARRDPDGYRAIVRTNLGQLLRMAPRWSLIPGPLWILAAWGAWRSRRSPVLWLVVAVATVPAASALAFFVQPRYLTVSLALATVPMGVASAQVAHRWRPLVAGLAVAVATGTSVLTFRGETAGWWHPVEQTEQRRAGEWLAGHTRPGDLVMTRSMIVDHYAARPSAALPHAPLADVLAYARHYGVRYVVADWYTVERLVPELSFLLHVDEVPGLRLVQEVRAEGRVARVFALDPLPAAPSLEPPPLGFTGDG